MHIIGKDIIRFHAVYWPAFLMSAGIPVQKRVYAHGFLFNRGEKMSKSVGNVVDPFNLADQYGVDQMRYFFLREVPFGQDGSYNHEAIVARINADLANDLGNLAQRSLSMIAKQLGGVLPEPGDFSDNDKAILAQADGMLAPSRDRDGDPADPSVAQCGLGRGRRRPTAISPAKRHGRWPRPIRRGRSTVLYVTAEVVRQIAILAQPAMPDASAKLLDSLGIPEDARDFAALAKRLTARHDAAGAGRRVPALCRTDGGLNGQPCLSTATAISIFPTSPMISTPSSRAPSAAGIGRIVTISTRVRRLGALLEIAARFPNVYCSVGTHPHQADEEDGIPAEELIELTRHPKVVALGEAGLDYFYEHGSRQAQERGFRAHIAAARATGLPLVIHTREADEDCGRILRGRNGQGIVSRRAALLHRRARAGDESDRRWAFRFRSRAF